MNVTTGLRFLVFILSSGPVPFMEYVPRVTYEDQCLHEEQALLWLLRAEGNAEML